jgi:hypothetical protein
VVNGPNDWVRADGAFPPAIDAETFAAAQAIIAKRREHWPDAELLDGLRGLYESTGSLTHSLIDGAEGLPSGNVLAYRFGSLLTAYRQVGYRPRRNFLYVPVLQRLKGLRCRLIDEIIAALRALGCAPRQTRRPSVLVVDGELTIAVVVVRCHQMLGGVRQWRFRLGTCSAADIVVAARMDDRNVVPLDYYLLPRIAVARKAFLVNDRNGPELDAYRFASLDPLYQLVQPADVGVAA